MRRSDVEIPEKVYKTECLVSSAILFSKPLIQSLIPLRSQNKPSSLYSRLLPEERRRDEGTFVCSPRDGRRQRERTRERVRQTDRQTERQRDRERKERERKEREKGGDGGRKTKRKRVNERYANGDIGSSTQSSGERHGRY